MARGGTKTILYGTMIMPNVVKGVLGNFPRPSTSLIEQKLPFFKNSQFPENVTEANGRYPSVSTVLGCTTSQRLLYRWQLKMIEQLGSLGAFKKYMRVRVELGTHFHSYIKRILEKYKNEEVFPDNEVDQMIADADTSIVGYLNSVLPILRTLGKENMELERNTNHHGLCYSGRFDAIVTYKDAVFLMDWKTASLGSAKDGNVEIKKMYNDPLQLAAYIGAVNSDPNFRKLPEIRYGAVVVAKENGMLADVVEMNSADLEVYWNKWLDCVRQFWTEMKTRSIENGVISFVWNGKESAD